jgi:endonuclease G, mitochondrial
MSAPNHIADAARQRIHYKLGQIRNTLHAVATGRPQDAEPDKVRQAAVLQRRTGGDASLAVAMSGGREGKWGKTIDFVDAVFLERGMNAARSVVRVVTRGGQDIGTGFLISPRLLLTNNHVLPDELAAADLLIEFEYERNLRGVMKEASTFALDPDGLFLTSDEDSLDYTVIAVGQRVRGQLALSHFGFLPISGARDKHQLSDHVNIIQHPDGRPKEAVLRENQLVSRAPTALHYVADTETGSSGSPVFNVLWEVVALHHWGGPHRDLVDENGAPVAKTVNEGIRISAIVSELSTAKNGLDPARRALVTDALTIGLLPPPALRRSAESQPGALTHHVTEDSLGAEMDIGEDGTATWTIPLRVSVRLGGGAVAARAPAREIPDAARQPSAAPAGRPERTAAPDADYSNRPGYDQGFLGGARIPLPSLKTRAMRADRARNKEATPGRDEFELTYQHFSVVMNGRRKLAFFTATNIDGESAKNFNRQTGEITDARAPIPNDETGGPEASERWFPERRIEDDEQTPSGFYERQTTFDSSGDAIENRRSTEHLAKIFQQGHLTRRQDPIWGSDEEAIRRANADTFHVTNRAPQVGYFNMGLRKLSEAKDKHPGGQLHWRAIEDFVLKNAIADQKRVTVFTGPIFDDQNDIPWDRGVTLMRGFKAPREYWKVILRREKGKLRATALVADQTPLIEYVPERTLSDAEVERVSFDRVEDFHVSITELESRTGLDFGEDVRAADTKIGAERKLVNSVVDVLGEVAKTDGASA